ncbi:putative GntR family transcriptional regulator [Gordonia effusa NBRC 100432]|uniref:Putative GntR family transcriptional regulator n=1 Tax=Gordonia effusa NBRC 100432 TaxID=1077974 RepID=H0R0U3_9ACTN|nr:GntR family transcriptional regulator [Gordonia effusa]GAB18694.1 putative GntR family transcriptional regulator [Gordonia effusa NBRC 100432]
MTFQPVVRRSVPEDVYDQIVDRVVGGELPAGEALPSERDLAAALGVSRPAVREALKRLDAVGFIRVKQGGTTTVRDIRRDGGLDLLPMLLVHNGELDVAVARSIVEARAHIAPIVAELAAQRSSSDTISALRQLTEAVAAESDSLELQRIALHFWDIVVDGAESIAYRLMFNTMRAAYEPALPALSFAMAGEVGKVDGYTALVDAIAAHDAPLARRAADNLLSPSTSALFSALDALDTTGIDS